MRILTDDEHDELLSAKADYERAERRAIMFGDIVHSQVLAMRAAVVAWQRDGAEAGMRWIANSLSGPGHLPTEADIAVGAQPLFDRETAEHEAFRAAHTGPARAPLAAAVDDLLRQVALAGQVLTVEQRPLQPLAMGHYETVYSLRGKR